MLRRVGRRRWRSSTKQPIDHFALSPDGRWVAAITYRVGPKRAYLFVIPSSGGEPRPLAASVSSWSIDRAVSWSRDGRFVFVVKVGAGEDGRLNEVWEVPLDGTEPRNTGVSWPGRGAAIERISAHPDGRRLAISTAVNSSTTWVLQSLSQTK